MYGVLHLWWRWVQVGEVVVYVVNVDYNVGPCGYFRCFNLGVLDITNVCWTGVDIDVVFLPRPMEGMG